MKKYNIVKPEDYTKEHFEYIHKFRESTDFLATQMELMFFVRDVNSKFIMGTDISATKFGLKSGKDFIGKFTHELPCESVANHAWQIVRQEQSLIETYDINKSIEVLNVFEFTDGLKARMATKRLFYHQETSSILGVSSYAINVELKDFINIIPSYILRFGAIGSIESMQQDTQIDNVILSEYEQEICFLLMLGWDFKQITDFMDIFRPRKVPRTIDAIIKKKNYICGKFGITNTSLKNLCEYLFSIGFHHKMPESFYSRIIGVKVMS
ncbi:MAG: hypothetical protein K0R94_168 [Burkholderiales bacterium]|jgi:hypothetical protein|nr:hypothetical protein [Burkholderiales bacterium]